MSGGGRSHRTRHGWAVLPAAGCRIRRPATAAASSAAGLVPSTLAPPEALDPLVVGLPAGLPKQGGNPAIAVSAILTGQLDHVRDQPALVITSTRSMTLRGAVLAEHPAGPALRYPETLADMIDATSAARGAQKFCSRCPAGPFAASLRICLSRVKSETARRSRSFSFSSSFSRRS